MFMKAITVNTVSGSPLFNKYLISAMILVVLILVGFLAYHAQQNTGLAVVPPEMTMISQSALEEQYGLRVNLVAVTAAGGLVDVRFKFVDGEKVKVLLQDPANFPTLQVPGSPVTLSAPEEGRPAEITFEDDANLFLMYPNAAGVVKPGTPVVVRFGSTQLEAIPAK
jgi:hypothetical protein